MAEILRLPTDEPRKARWIDTADVAKLVRRRLAVRKAWQRLSELDPEFALRVL